MNMGIKIGGQIEKVNGKELCYSEFVQRYMKKNQPVLLTGLVEDWKACKDWVTDNGQPNLQFFATHFGKSRVQVADCGTREFTDQKRVEMSVSDFAEQWFKSSVAQQCSNATQGSNSQRVLYLKDWHFVKEYPEYLAYTTPLFFSDDWLNLYLDNYRMHTDPDNYHQNNEISCSDYRFVYMGAKGSWTPLHADVFRSYSWSANVRGKKRWLFLCPSQCHFAFDRNSRSCVYNIFDEVIETEFPGFKKAIWLECIQEENEILFVPSGWYHQVHNLEDTISINHNWFNAFNLSWVWNLLLRDYNEAKEYIEDIRDICDDFEGLCQRNLAANTGMNFYDFFMFITRFSLANLVLLCYLIGEHGSPRRSLSALAQNLALNLGTIRDIAVEIKCMCSLEGNYRCLLDTIETLEDPKFFKLCMGLARTYGMINKQCLRCSDFEKALMEDLIDLDILKKYSSQVCTPEDLIKFIDNAVSKLSGIFSEELSIIYDS
ncbi:jmjC domain-containing protein 4 [Quillaja saponaria]|uniref:JmjC domain-containing protein 4 n=1 Tax=Quillaja saponaria TaxID=32244 RepID=A0AAD7P8A3_QUISA|nr:jmjC domain-containing protein 4 [Quillaja saponaria]